MRNPAIPALLLCLTACQTVAGTASATVDLSDPATRAAVTSALASAVGRARVELGPTNSPQTSSISVLPPRPGPYETNSTARPIHFDLIWHDGHCVAVRRDTGTPYDLPGVRCQ